jgi:hypothetical protein
MTASVNESAHLQTPFTQSCPGAHFLLQPPQWRGSVFGETQTCGPQSWVTPKPAFAHGWQMGFSALPPKFVVQTWSLAQRLPQAPQFCGSVLATQREPQARGAFQPPLVTHSQVRPVPHFWSAPLQSAFETQAWPSIAPPLGFDVAVPAITGEAVVATGAVPLGFVD